MDVPTMTEMDPPGFDEFAWIRDFASAEGFASPMVQRRTHTSRQGDTLSYLQWGPSEPKAVLLHGGGQNAHTWDRFALYLGVDAVAFDLPGHGHSTRRKDGDYWPRRTAEAISLGIEDVAPHAEVIVGMSLGGLTAIRLARCRPDLAPRIVIVDVTPSVEDASRSDAANNFDSSRLIKGPRVFADFDEMVKAVAEVSPNRDPVALRMGVRQNAFERPDGKWTWRYDLPPFPSPSALNEMRSVWDDVSNLDVPALVIRGSLSKHVSSDDLDEFRSRHSDSRTKTMEGAGHSIQSYRPAELASWVTEFVAETHRRPHV